MAIDRILQRRNAKQPPLTKNTPSAPTAQETELLQLQRLIGNQATQRLANQGVIQLGRKKRRGKGGGSPATGPTLTQDEIKKLIAKGNKRRAAEKAAKNSWLGYFASWIPGGTYEAPKADEDEDEAKKPVSYGESAIEGEDSTFTGEAELGEAKPEEESNEGLKNPFAIEQIEIDLGTAKLDKKGTAIGDIKGSVQDSLTGDGKYRRGAKGSAEGQYGKAEGEGKIELSPDNLEGEGKVSLLFGASGEKKSGTLGWGIGGHKLEGSGKMESKLGLSGDLAAKLAYKSSGDLAAEGKIGAFLGALTEAGVAVKLKSGGKDLGTTEGKLGIAYGAGGELSGTIKWEGGAFEFGWQGKLVAGIGFSYGYKVTLNTQAVADSIPGWLTTVKYWLWDAWELPADMDLDDILII